MPVLSWGLPVRQALLARPVLQVLQVQLVVRELQARPARLAVPARPVRLVQSALRGRQELAVVALVHLRGPSSCPRVARIVGI